MGRNEKFALHFFFSFSPYFSFLVFPGSSAGKEATCNAGDFSSIPGLGISTGEGIGYPLVFLCFPDGPAGKESACKAEDLGSIPGLGRCPGKEKGYPLKYSGLENSMNCLAHGVTESDMTERLSHFFCFAAGKIKLTG